MPLDDVYIHFQYARQIAAGQPYVYNPGLPPSSGATSFLYPYLLALGVLLGFDGLNLGLWAMALGGLALAGSAWLVFLLARRFATPRSAVLTSVAFALSGPVAWHYMSGMETGIVILLVLATLYTVVRRDVPGCAVAGALLALIRPEGGLLAVIAAGLLLLRVLRGYGLHVGRALRKRPELFWLALPVLAIVVQPLVNIWITGSAVASGNQAKSVLGMIPPYFDAIAGTIFGNATRIGLELLTGYNAREGWYFPFVLSILALVGLVGLLRRRDTRLVGVLLLVWLAAAAAAIATLDTAFWHFKRYQMPLIALLYPLAAWGVAFWPRRASWIGQALLLISVVFLAVTFAPFYGRFLLNAGYVYEQPLQMARWLAANAPEDAVVAVHDTGMMRYLGGRITIDIVGLTTPGAALSWRNGPGAVAEYLDNARPDLIASYGHGHGYGLGYLADTSLYARELAVYPVELDEQANVALAAPTQGIYAPDWAATDRGEQPAQPSILALIESRGGRRFETVDVGNVASEQAHRYQWRDAERLGGFPTDVYEQRVVGCGDESCLVLDGGRRINGEETFEIRPEDAARDVLMVTRLHPVNAGTYTGYVNGNAVARRWIPALPGAWLEVPVLIPHELMTTPTQIRVVPETPGGHYMPYHHWFYQLAADAGVALPDEPPYATFQDGRILLYEPELSYDPATGQLALGLTWGTAQAAEGDYKLFVHVLGDDERIVAQLDQRPWQDTLPPGNWIPGVFTETIMVDLAQVPPGRYRVVLGYYDPVSFERLSSDPGDDSQRVYLGDVEINGDG